ncbi:hypothetical protein HYU19_00685 [Candidatus Woesearchaeota archaeon]|nr:hypothetical protein [Candidatus Woesearchaeota archaeon]
MKGLFIVIYGVNNIGKTTQAMKLVDHLKREGYKAEYLKYPNYDSPTGRQISEILRSGRPQAMTEVEFQTLYFKNRREFEPALQKKLEAGTIVVAEDYVGTSLAWGSAKGASYFKLKTLNAGLIQEDVAILLHGDRYVNSVEHGHLHETDPELAEKVRQKHLEIGKKLGWLLVDANQPLEKVFSNVLKAVMPVVEIRILYPMMQKRG